MREIEKLIPVCSNSKSESERTGKFFLSISQFYLFFCYFIGLIMCFGLIDIFFVNRRIYICLHVGGY